VSFYLPSPPPFVEQTAKELPPGTWLAFNGHEARIQEAWNGEKLILWSFDRSTGSERVTEIASESLGRLGPVATIGGGAEWRMKVLPALTAGLLGAVVARSVAPQRDEWNELKWRIELIHRVAIQDGNAPPLNLQEVDSVADLLSDWWVGVAPELRRDPPPRDFDNPGL